jgi:hypothetical protein
LLNFAWIFLYLPVKAQPTGKVDPHFSTVVTEASGDCLFSQNFLTKKTLIAQLAGAHRRRIAIIGSKGIERMFRQPPLGGWRRYVVRDLTTNVRDFSAMNLQ